MTTEEARFSIVYDGEAVAEGSIDAKELAPALLALADLVDEAQPLVPQLEARITVRVRAGFEHGSFEVSLELARLYQQFVSLFSGHNASAWSNLFQILGISGAGVGFGLFQLIKRARGRKTTSVTIEHTERVRITFEGERDPVEVDQRVWKLFRNLRARKAVERIIDPLRKTGINLFKIRHQGRETVEVNQNEAGYFIAPTEHEGETVNLVDTRLVIVAPSFQEGNKWRISDGARTIFVTIEDEAFARAVQSGTEAFRKGDILHVRLQTRQWIDGTELKAEHSIVRVHRRENAPEQHKLFPPENPDA